VLQDCRTSTLTGREYRTFVHPVYGRAIDIEIAKLSTVGGAVEFRVGTASWTDPTLVNSDLFYPPSVGSAEERLRFYAGQFNTVEVDSTYYALPAERNAKLWAERTPEGFLFNIKPFALMTQHPAEMSRLPKQLREILPAEERSNRQLTRPSKEVVDMAFQMFWSAMAPLREAGRLGVPAFQFSPYFIPKPVSRLSREPSSTATGSLDRKRISSPKLGSGRNSMYRNHELFAISWLVLHFDRRTRR